ncbi:peptidoglycan D,D-transpeptidase FtsI family protein [Numidum massiliense]|uniref:peptidoglycan D,D-transpeptidase FtsI family protein n=1 Tax=Numidum massiliense TaxID=1522315 RepID=UPI0006D590E1|nr:penicillin-binding transpeptidase domain-containing protein [Numidum massiliense]
MIDKEKKLHIKRKKMLFNRLHLLWFFIFILFTVLYLNVGAVQLVKGDHYSKIARENDVKEIPITAPRGVIYDRKGEPLVSNEPIFAAMYIETGESDEEKIAMAKRLAKLLKMKPEKVIEAMDVGIDIKGKARGRIQPAFSPKKIKDYLKESQVAKIRERPQDYPGVNVVMEPLRRYRKDTVAVQTIGYVRPFAGSQSLTKYEKIKKKNPSAYLDWEQVGNDGIEFSYQDYLRGKHGSTSVRVDHLGKIIEEVDHKNPEIGNSLYLNIDERIQLEGEKFIEKHLRDNQYPPQTAYASVMDVKTGKVRALISYPDYDPNIWNKGVSDKLYRKEMQYVMNNGAIGHAPPDVRRASDPEKEIFNHPSSILPMGSTFKPITIFTLINEGVIGPNTGWSDPQYFKYANGTPPITNAGFASLGFLTPKTALQKSSNTYMAWGANKLYGKTGGEKGDSLQRLGKYARIFGLFTETGIDLPGESSGEEEYMAVAKTTSVQGALIQASFGQYNRATAIQLAQYAATVANRGKRMQPQVVDKIVSADGKVVKKLKPKVMSEAKDVKPEAFDTIIAGMKLVANTPEGTGRDLMVLSKPAAAKTGTSEQIVGGRIVENAVMLAYYPADDPQVAVSAIVPEGGYGSLGAGPIVLKLIQLYEEQFMHKGKK